MKVELDACRGGEEARSGGGAGEAEDDLSHPSREGARAGVASSWRARFGAGCPNVGGDERFDIAQMW